MAKKSEEVKNGLVEEVVVEKTPVAEKAPTQNVEINKPESQVATPGHATRGFRG